MSGVNPQGVQVHSFKVPSSEELDHDYLWRYARRLPARGEIGIFNRSHYEEVLVVRVHRENLDRQKIPERCKQGDVFEAALRGDQRLGALPDRERLPDREAVPQPVQGGAADAVLRRIDLPDHNWKFSAADVREREFWDDYQDAFSEMLSHTSTEWAPWYVIPADRKWFARIGAGAVLVNTLMEIDPQFPVVTKRAPAVAARDQGDAGGPGAEGRRGGPVPAGELRDGDRDAILRAARRRRLVRRFEPEAIAARLGVDPAVGLSSQRGGGAAGAQRAQRAPRRAGRSGLAAVRRAVPQLHADDPGRRGDRLARDQGVEHGRAADRDHGGQRDRRPAPGGQGARAR